MRTGPLMEPPQRLKRKSGRGVPALFRKKSFASPLAKAPLVGRDGDQDALYGSREAGKGVITHGAREQRRRQLLVIGIGDDGEAAAIETERSVYLRDAGRGTRGAGRAQNRRRGQDEH